MDTEKLEKAARKSADNSTFLHSDSFEINTGKLQGNDSVLFIQLIEKTYSLESDKKSAKQIAAESFTDNEVLLIQHRKYIP